jgi:dTDP-glucose 4,6-dehydratase
MGVLSDGRVLVTGAGGFIGSHLVEHLVERGFEVRAFVHYNSLDSRGWLDRVRPEVQGHFEVATGDVRDPHGVEVAMRGCRSVLHLAALIGIPYSYHAPDSYLDTNIRGTLNVLQAARHLELSRVVHTSTSEVYGTAQRVPISEDHPIHPQSPYAATKAAADHLALSFQKSFGTPVTVVRPFNTYGPRQSTRAVIPTVLSQIASGAKKIRLGSLTPTRDFTFVTDTARGFVAVAEADAAIGSVVNLGSGFEISIEDAARAMAKALDAEVEIELDPARVRPASSEVERLFADATRARTLAAWEPRYGGREGFERGVRETAAWFADPKNLAGYRVGTYTV